MFFSLCFWLECNHTIMSALKLTETFTALNKYFNVTNVDFRINQGRKKPSYDEVDSDEGPVAAKPIPSGRRRQNKERKSQSVTTPYTVIVANDTEKAAIERIADDLRVSASGVVEECSELTSPNRQLSKTNNFGLVSTETLQLPAEIPYRPHDMDLSQEVLHPIVHMIWIYHKKYYTLSST